MSLKIIKPDEKAIYYSAFHTQYRYPNGEESKKRVRRECACVLLCGAFVAD